VPAKKKRPTPKQIREARLAAGLSQRLAAELINYSERAWQEWEAGRRKMRQETFEIFRSRADLQAD
jgi:DNA-binding transcriptional regulator YiaG